VAGYGGEEAFGQVETVALRRGGRKGGREGGRKGRREG